MTLLGRVTGSLMGPTFQAVRGESARGPGRIRGRGVESRIDTLGVTWRPDPNLSDPYRVNWSVGVDAVAAVWCVGLTSCGALLRPAIGRQFGRTHVPDVSTRRTTVEQLAAE